MTESRAYLQRFRPRPDACQRSRMKLVSTIVRHVNIESIVTELPARGLGVALGKSVVAYGDPLKGRPIEVL